MLVIPSIDVEAGRSRLVHWPGASTGEGTPTDRPERIAERFVNQGARMVHVVDLDGAKAGQPVNLDAIGRISSRVGVPLQVAGGLEGPEAIKLAFASGATRVVLSMSVADRPDLLRKCVAVAGDWLAVGLDPRPDRISAYPWRRSSVPTLVDLAGEMADLGVRRLVLSHAGTRPDASFLADLVRTLHLEILVAGGLVDLDTIKRLRDSGIAGIILGEPLLTGAIDFAKALEISA